MLFLKILYFGPSQMSLNESVFRSPMTYSASLSKQQGTTYPSHVTTGLNHNLAHLSGKELFKTYSPSRNMYRRNLLSDGNHEPISFLSTICIDFNLKVAFSSFASSFTCGI